MPPLPNEPDFLVGGTRLEQSFVDEDARGLQLVVAVQQQSSAVALAKRCIAVATHVGEALLDSVDDDKVGYSRQREEAVRNHAAKPL